MCVSTSPGDGSPGSACESPRPRMYVDDDVDVVDVVDDYVDVDVDVVDVDDVDVVDDDADHHDDDDDDDDDDVDEMRETIVIRLPKRTTRGISQNIGPAQSKRTFPGSTSVLAIYIYIYIYIRIYAPGPRIPTAPPPPSGMPPLSPQTSH